MAIRCYYSIVRYVPDDLRDESVNIGVLLQSQPSTTPEACLSSFSSPARATQLDPLFDRSSVHKLIEAAKARLLEQAHAFPLSELVRRYSSGRVQLTTPRLSLTEDLQLELDDLKSRFIVEEGPSRELGYTLPRLRQDVRETLGGAFPKIPDKVIKFTHRSKPLEYAGSKGKHQFDVSLKSPNGIDLVRCITFDVKGYSEKVNAAKIFVWDSDDVVSENKKNPHAPVIDFVSILYPPDTFVNGNVKAFKDAQSILSDKGIRTLNFHKDSDRAEFVSIAKKRVAEASASAK